MSDQPASVNVRLALEQAALQQSSQGVDKLKQQFVDLKSQTQSAGSSADNAIRSLANDASETTTEVKRLNSALEQTSQTAAKVKSGGFGVEGLRRTGGALTQLGLGDLGVPVQRLGDLGQIVKELGTVTGETTGEITGASAAMGVLETVLSPVTLAIAAVGLAILDLKGILDLIKKSADEAVAAQKAKFEQDQQEEQQRRSNRAAARTLTAGQNAQDIQDTFEDTLSYTERIAQKQKEIAENDAKYAALGSSFNPAERSKLAGVGAELKSELQQLMKEQNETFAQNQNDVTLKSMIAARDFSENFNNGIASANKSLSGWFQQVSSGFKKIEDEQRKKDQKEIEALQKAAQERANKEVEIVQKMDNQIADVEEAAAQKRVEIANKLQDALVKAAADAVEASQKALDKLTEARDRNLSSLDRDLSKQDREAANTRLNDQIEEQRKERDDLQAHLAALQQIRDRDQSRERDDLLNRNYRDLFALKEQQNVDIQGENKKFILQQEQDRQALADKLSDEKRAADASRRERLIAYEQQNEDAVHQYKIELTQAEAAKEQAIQLARQTNVKELADLHNAATQRENILRQSALNELKLLTQTKQAEQQIFEQALNRAQQMLGINSAGAFNSPRRIASATSFAYGGTVTAGEPAAYNDRFPGQSESFNGFRLPGGRGLLFPEQPGTINSTGGGDTHYQQINNISGVTDPGAIADLIDQRTTRLLNKIKGRRSA